MALKIVPYQEGDEDYMVLRPGDYMTDGLRNGDAEGQAFTLWDEEQKEIVGIVGCSVIYPGVAGAWALISDSMRGRNALEFTRFCKAILPAWIATFKLHRLQIVVLTSNEEYNRFAKAIGFEYEGVMRKVAPDKRDMALYAIVE